MSGHFPVVALRLGGVGVDQEAQQGGGVLVRVGLLLGRVGEPSERGPEAVEVAKELEQGLGVARVGLSPGRAQYGVCELGEQVRLGEGALCAAAGGPEAVEVEFAGAGSRRSTR
ncbi:hypothetical protein [Streptomyces sp. BF23-19]|uniref:hypothetical protein n=1 Tax=unclassified Streptomyces TaxID=2593676 RepID=UPI0034E5C170